MTASSKCRAAFAATAASAVLAVVPFVGAQPAHSQPYPPPGPSLTIDPTAVEPGGEVDFTGTGFQAEQDVVAALASRIVILGHFTADATGTVEGTVTIPEKTKPGEHRFLLKAKDPDRTLSTELDVLGDPGHDYGGKPGHHPDKLHLADTGDDRSAVLLGGVAGLLLLGGGAILLARRVKRG